MFLNAFLGLFKELFACLMVWLRAGTDIRPQGALLTDEDRPETYLFVFTVSMTVWFFGIHLPGGA